MAGVRTVQNIYMVANPNSCEGYANLFLEKYPRETHYQLEVAVTRRAGLVQFVVPENLTEA